MHVVCTWIGNSQPVAAKHYLQVTDEHFEKAASESNGCEHTTQPGKTKAMQEAMQNAHASGGMAMNAQESITQNTLEMQNNSATCASMRSGGMSDIGFEPTTSCV
jgi:hypothetical protein